MSGIFDEKTNKVLTEPLPKEAVKTREGTGKQTLSYLPSYYVINMANEVFGFGMWSTEILTLQQIDKTEYEKPPYKAGDKPKQMISISYLCKLRLTVNGTEKTAVHEDTGFGNGVAGNTAHGVGVCIELASKEAVTDALKRCLRYYGNQFGLSLYDKESDDVVPLAEIEAARIVTEEQLSALRGLYDDRGINDEWVLKALQGEHYPHDSLEIMRNDWYQLAMKITREYKLEEIASATYEADIDKVINMMKESATMNMLKGLFKEAWEKTSARDDKERKLTAQQIYEEMKEKFQEK